MNIKILCVGKIKEDFYQKAIGEYSKRLQKYARLTITEVQDEKTPDKLSDHECEIILDKEGDRLLKLISDNDHVIALAIEGRSFDSVSFAKYIDRLGIDGLSNIVFVIGGSLGLSDRVKTRADLLLSFSDMTFPHQLMRVILLEQIYRGYRINTNEPYHK